VIPFSFVAVRAGFLAGLIACNYNPRRSVLFLASRFAVYEGEKGYVMKEKLAALVLVVCGAFGVAASGWAQAEWVRTEKTDPLTNASRVRFALSGRFLQAPSKGSVDKPSFVLVCDPTKTQMRGKIRGKVLGAFIEVGAVVDSGNDFERDALFERHPNATLVGVKYRRDDEKKVQEAEWFHSGDFAALYVASQYGGTEIEVNNLLYGHMLTHKEGKGEQVRRIVLSVPEYLGGDVVMQFDLPDLTNVSDACGLVEHNR